MNEELAHLKKEKEHKERDARMKYGKRYKEVLARAKKAVKLTKTTADDALLEAVKGALVNREESA